MNRIDVKSVIVGGSLYNAVFVNGIQVLYMNGQETHELIEKLQECE